MVVLSLKQTNLTEYCKLWDSKKKQLILNQQLSNFWGLVNTGSKQKMSKVNNWNILRYVADLHNSFFL